MSYYTGQGDYYSGKGDPGLFGFIGKALGTVARVGTSLIPGPVGSLARAATSRLPSFTPSRAPVGPPAPPRFTAPPVLRAGPARAGPGQGTAVATVAAGGQCVPGYHLDKQTGTYCVRNRRMNPANPKALRRAIRREKAFIGLARTALRGTGYKISRTTTFARKKCR
jgi:hypothetical protein